MSLKEWAEKEVQIACKKENPDKKDGEWDYGCACFESALKAFNSLLEDGHSGFSIAMTKRILNRLIECKPLTPIEDTTDVWNESYVNDREKCKVYQCNRMSALFKYVYDDGKTTYSDIDRIVCVDINNPDVTYSSGIVRKVINEMFPITMPYYPTGQIKVYCEEFLTNRKNGDFDTLGILYVIKPIGEKFTVERYFKEDKDGFIEIDRKEYMERRKIAIKERENNG